MITAIIPARAGSRGIPGKNTRIVNGKPLVCWSIEAAISLVDQIVVSTNDPEVERVIFEDPAYSGLIHFGKLNIVQRPEEISNDDSPTELALIHAMDEMTRLGRRDSDWVVTLQPTSPVRNDDLLLRCLRAIKSYRRADSLLTVSRHTPFFYRRYDMSTDMLAIPFDHKPCRRKMRQDMRSNEFVFHDNGSVYITDWNVLRDTGCRIGSRPIMVECSKYQSLQIDTQEDLSILDATSSTIGPFV